MAEAAESVISFSPLSLHKVLVVQQRENNMGTLTDRLEDRAAETDRWVKEQLAKEREAIISKNAMLKALRLAREELKVSS
jgi:hypothetical protein